MGRRRESITRRCPKCSININMCFCNKLSKIDTKAHISIIYHVKEYFLTSNTGKIAELCLNNSSHEIRGLKNKPLEEDYTLGGKYQPLYLFPSDDAELLTSEYTNSFEKPINLIIADATWSQARKFHKREPNLLGIPHVKIPFKEKSKYQLRRQVNEEGLCTIEAIAYGLKALNENSACDHLLDALKVMNDLVMETRTHKKE